MSRSAPIVLSILPHSSAAWNVFGNGRGWLDECWYEKWRALNCNFGILSLLKSSCVYLFNIHPGPGSINSAPPKPFKNKKPVRRTKCEQLTERSAFGLMWKYQCCPNTPFYFGFSSNTVCPTHNERHYQLLPKPPCFPFTQQRWSWKVDAGSSQS